MTFQRVVAVSPIGRERYRRQMDLSAARVLITGASRGIGLEIARALASEPNFMLLDEPFAGVDPISVTDIKNGILDLKSRGLGVLITDHNVKETLDICDRAYIVHEGHVIAAGEPENILQNETVRSVYLGDSFAL